MATVYESCEGAFVFFDRLLLTSFLSFCKYISFLKLLMLVKMNCSLLSVMHLIVCKVLCFLCRFFLLSCML